MDEEEENQESLVDYKDICPECGNILDIDGIWEEGGLYSCDVCGTFWKYSNKQQKWIIDDPLRKVAR